MTISFTSDGDWDVRAIRRAIRVLASHSPNVTDTSATLRSLRLLWDMLHRRDVPCSIVEPLGTMPLVVAGSGRLLVVSHLDDLNPGAQVPEAAPPTIAGDDVRGPGVVRKANVLAVLGLLLANPAAAEQVTLVVEADRHRGSLALEQWLGDSRGGASWRMVACDVEDQPVPVPALLRGAEGRVTLQVSLESDGHIERVLAGIVLDAGHRLASALAGLKSIDNEVLVPGFYDGVLTPETDEIASLASLGDAIGAWLAARGVAGAAAIGTRHLALGAYLAPTITIQTIEMNDASPWLARRASAQIDIRTMPGQDNAAIVSACIASLRERVPELRVTPLLVRPPAAGSLPTGSAELVRCVLPVAIGNSPAGLLAATGASTFGFTLVGPATGTPEESVTLSAIRDGSTTLAGLVDAALADW